MDNENTLDAGRLSIEQHELLTKLLEEEGIDFVDESTISRQEKSGDVPLSFAQERLWFFDQLLPNSSLYNLPLALRLLGELNVKALFQSLNEIIQRHEILRTTFTFMEGHPQQKIAPTLELAPTVIDLRHLSAHERETHAQQLIAEELRQPFNLAIGPLMRTTVFHLDEEEYILLLIWHHIVFDGWSIRIFLRELSFLYPAFLTGEHLSLPKLSLQYADFALWQRQHLQGKMLAELVQFWQTQLARIPTILELPFDYPRPPIQSFRGSQYFFQLPLHLVEALKALGSQQECTLFMTLLAGFSGLLHRYSGQEQFIVGTPIAAREHIETEDLIGFFVNTLALPIDLSGNPHFYDVLARIQEMILGAYAHQEVPFEYLVEQLHPQRDASRSPLVQVMFILQNTSAGTINLPSLVTTPLPLKEEIARFDLTLELTETAHGISGMLEYNTDLFEPATMVRLAQHFQVLLEEVVTHSQTRVSQLPLLTDAERQNILNKWNATRAPYPQGYCIHQLFEEQVKRTPDAIAVKFEDQRVTYQKLNQHANQLAHALQALGVGPEVLVGLCLDRSVELMVGLLAILKAGGAYVPLDPKYPKDRLTFMLNDARVLVLLTQQSLLNSLFEIRNISILCIDTMWKHIAQHSKEAPASQVCSRNLAYMIYTSGSTGMPKGVQIEHGGLCSLSVAQTQAFNIGPQDRVLQFASLSFDASIWEIVMALTTGATLFLASSISLLPGTQLSELLKTEAITAVTLSPSVLAAIPVTHLPELRTLIVAGEACKADLVAQWGAKHNFYNAYGPSEATICASIAHCFPGRQPVIGRPIANVQMYILDAFLQPVPIGVSGELYLGGIGLARGYLQRPDLTAERFLPHPFSTEPGVRLYKTGDMVRYLPNGNIEFLGRLDHQVKLRGFRIELGEIEAALASHPAVQKAIIVMREDLDKDKQLVAYLTLHSQPSASISDLRIYLSQQVPDYMLPSAFVVLQTFPLTPSGKVDRYVLPAPDAKHLVSKVTYVAPSTPIEKELAAIWSELLGVEKIGIHDNFFELGGHSLLVTRVISRIHDSFQIEFPLHYLFKSPTVAQIAIIILHLQAELVDNELLAHLLREIGKLSDAEI